MSFELPVDQPSNVVNSSSSTPTLHDSDLPNVEVEHSFVSSNNLLLRNLLTDLRPILK
jgi:hypothetical protein